MEAKRASMSLPHEVQDGAETPGDIQWSIEDVSEQYVVCGMCL